jgi:hypothetical protein
MMQTAEQRQMHCHFRPTHNAHSRGKADTIT